MGKPKETGQTSKSDADGGAGGTVLGETSSFGTQRLAKLPSAPSFTFSTVSRNKTSVNESSRDQANYGEGVKTKHGETGETHSSSLSSFPSVSELAGAQPKSFSFATASRSPTRLSDLAGRSNVHSHLGVSVFSPSGGSGGGAALARSVRWDPALSPDAELPGPGQYTLADPVGRDAPAYSLGRKAFGETHHYLIIRKKNSGEFSDILGRIIPLFN